MTVEPSHDEKSDLIVLDAGPILNFMSRNETCTLYLDTLKYMTGSVAIPDAVLDEVNHKASRDRRFTLCQRKLQGIVSGGHAQKLETPAPVDDEDYAFHWTWVKNACSPSMLQSGKHRGEMVLIAHARQLISRGIDVVAMIDDQDAIKLAHKAQVSTFTTVDLFFESISAGLISTRAELKRLYGLVQPNDDGLLPFERTDLEHHSWPSTKAA
jgi:predicted nucleic acid-binding protein